MNGNSPTAQNNVLADVIAFLQRFVCLSDVQALVIALWVVHTHAIKAAHATPYLSITSVEKRCGKTRLLEVLNLLVANPWFTGSTSKAALVRKLDADCPSLLLDETDAAFARDKEYSEALRAVLNCGHSRDVDVVSLCVGRSMEVKDFHVFGPKAIAGIGALPDTVADRSIPIRMKRRASNEAIERFKRRHLTSETREMRKHILAWLEPVLPKLKDARPELPDQLSDRQQDGCEPLLAIADYAGGDWPQKLRKALIEIFTSEVAKDNSIGVCLLSDIREIFAGKGDDSLPTMELLSALCVDHRMWSELSQGRPISAARLAHLLKPYEIYHRKLRIGEGTPWGYKRCDFEDAWARYLPRNPEQVEQSSNDAGRTQSSDLEHIPDVPCAGILESPTITPFVPDVPDSGTDESGSERLLARCDD